MKVAPFALGLYTNGHRCAECGELLATTGGYSIILDAGFVIRLCNAHAGELAAQLVKSAP